ncbi:PulJ/GspJ family protein [Ramlibacter sp.]|uniref:PulJ/GspJ family protein n=1 Tax=Ramlibacter sp. TaxID=1917967 RepID=UPI003D12C4E2
MSAVRRQSGFTLVELLVALFVMALMAIMSWQGLDGMTRAQAATERRADEVLTLQTGLAQWNADLDALVQLPQITAIDWNGRVLRMTRRGTASVTDGIRVVAWTRRDGQWMRWQSASLVTRGDVQAAWDMAEQWSQNAGDAERRFEVAIVPLDDWQIFFFRGDAWTNPMSSDASSATSTSPIAAAAAAAAAGGTPTGRVTVVPDGVRLVLMLPTGRALSGRLTRDWVNPRVSGGKAA